MGRRIRPGREGRTPGPDGRRAPPWTVTHLHGGRTAAGSDGWTENAVFPGQSTLCSTTTTRPPRCCGTTTHALGITRYNVYAGLAGLYIIRDPEEASLGLPAGKYEIPLVDSGSKSRCRAGRDSHGTPAPTSARWHDGVLRAVHDGVNGTIWPYADVEPRQYRLRVAKTPPTAGLTALVLLDEKVANLLDRVTQIGNRWRPAGCSGIAAGRRSDPSRPLNGPTSSSIFAPWWPASVMVNTAARAVHGRCVSTRRPGTPDPDHRLPYPQVMEFRSPRSGRTMDSCYRRASPASPA